ncbi:hypothetical protein OROMI_022752 [Orobanche minor]
MVEGVSLLVSFLLLLTALLVVLSSLIVISKTVHKRDIEQELIPLYTFLVTIDFIKYTPPIGAPSSFQLAIFGTLASYSSSYTRDPSNHEARKILDETEQRNCLNRDEERHRCSWDDHRFYFLFIQQLLIFIIELSGQRWADLA